MAKKRPKKKTAQPPAKKNTPSPSSLANNLIVGLVVCFVLLMLYHTFPGYQWVAKGLAWQNLKITVSNPSLSTSQKYRVKLGGDYQYIEYVRQSTPDSAVILMPPTEIFAQANFNKKGAWGVKNKIWNTYFLYPRILVMEEEKERFSELYARATHVMIVNGWGYDRLEYTVAQQSPYSVLPIRQPQAQP